MSASDTPSQGPYNRKKKIELIDDLKRAENLLLEKQEELVTCQDELARIIAKSVQSQETPLALDEELLALRDSYDTLIRILERKEKEIAELQKTLAKQKKAEKAVPASSYSFRLDVYPRTENTYQSRIEHLLSGARTPLDGLDLDTIQDFIAGYLPVHAKEQKNSQVTDIEHIEKSTTASSTDRIRQIDTREAEKHGQLLTNVESTTDSYEAVPIFLVSLHAKPEDGFFYAQTPFKLDVDLRQKEDNNEFKPVRFAVSVYARDLASGKSTLIGTINSSYVSCKEVSTLSLYATGLSAGLYRIDSIASFSSMAGHTLPIASLNESIFIQVT